TSCDETAAALVDGGEIRSNVVSSQAELHARFGGVVPEVASRHHLELVLPVVQEALGRASLDDLEAIAVTQGPGLIGALLVGLSAAKALAWSRGLPLVPVDHLQGHVASLYLGPEPLEPPFTCLLASGGHTLLLDVQERGAFTVLGTTLDDAAGEAFDRGGADRDRRRRGCELRAARRPSRGRSAAPRPVHRQRGDDLFRRALCRGDPPARLSCVGCLRPGCLKPAEPSRRRPSCWRRCC